MPLDEKTLMRIKQKMAGLDTFVDSDSDSDSQVPALTAALDSQVSALTADTDPDTDPESTPLPTSDTEAECAARGRNGGCQEVQANRPLAEGSSKVVSCKKSEA